MKSLSENTYTHFVMKVLFGLVLKNGGLMCFFGFFSGSFFIQDFRQMNGEARRSTLSIRFSGLPAIIYVIGQMWFSLQGSFSKFKNTIGMENRRRAILSQGTLSLSLTHTINGILKLHS